MSEESHNPLIEPELEARIIAMVLGEASDFERDELLRLIEERPELVSFLRQMQRVHGLLSEVGEGEVESPAGNWKLPAEKRNAVQAVIRGDAAVQQASTNGAPFTPLRSAGRRRFLRSLVGGAVVLTSLGIGGLALFSFSKSEKAEQVTLAGMVWENERYEREPLVDGTNLNWQFENESLEGMENAAQPGAVADSRNLRRSFISANPDDTKSERALSAIQDTLGTIAGTTNDHDLGDNIQFFDDGFKFQQPLEAITRVETGRQDDLIWMDSESIGEAGINIAESDSQPNIAAFSVPNTSSLDSNFNGLMLGLADSKQIGVDFDFSLADTRNVLTRPALAETSPDTNKDIVGTTSEEERDVASIRLPSVIPNGGTVMLGGVKRQSQTLTPAIADDITKLSPRIIIGEEKEELTLGRTSIAQSTKEQTWDLFTAAQPENASGQINGGTTRDFATQLASPRQQQNQSEGRPFAGQEIAGKGLVSSVDKSMTDGEELRFGDPGTAFGEEIEKPTEFANRTVTNFFGRSGQDIEGKVATGGFGNAGGRIGGLRFDRDKEIKELQLGLPLAQESLGEQKADDPGRVVSNELSYFEQSTASEKNVLGRRFGLNVDSPAQSGEGLGVEDTRGAGGADYINFPLAMPTTEAATPALVKDNQHADTSLNLRGLVDVQSLTDAGVTILSRNEADLGKVEAIIQELEALEGQPVMSYSVEQPVQVGRQLQELSVAGQEAANLPVLHGVAPINQVQSKFTEAVDQYDGLMKQRRLAEAETVARKAKEANPNHPEAMIMVEKAKLRQQIAAIEDLKKLRSDSALDQFKRIEESFALPVADYKNSDSKSWKELTERRSALELKDEALVFSKGQKNQSQSRLPISKVSPIAGLNETSAADEAFSTFSLHVSDVSFKLAMAALGKGEWPEVSKIRIEEFVNAFDYGDPLPGNDQKVACAIEQSIHPFLQQRNLLRVSMRTAAAGRASTTPLRLTFLLDNSGSMERYDRQQTVRRAFAMLAQQLTPNDQVTLISFARRPRLLADQVSGSEAEKLVQLIDELPSEGGTNIEAALQLAYEKANEQQTPGAQNRIILLTDGAVNLGNANPESLSQLVTAMRNTGIAFDAAGISADGLNDEVLEALTRKGDGRYYLLDSLESADDGFAQQIAGALRPSAKNVKVQVEFNPKRVGKYKLLGFEKHALKKEDFRNDKVDAAEMAAAESGVAMYQFEALPDGEGDIGSVSVRFLDLSTGQMVENRWPIPYQADAPRPTEAAPSLRIASAAALFAAKLKGEALGTSVDLKTLSGLLSGLPDEVRSEKRVQQLQQMIEQARQLSEQE